MGQNFIDPAIIFSLIKKNFRLTWGYLTAPCSVFLISNCIGVLTWGYLYCLFIKKESVVFFVSLFQMLALADYSNHIE